MDWGDDVEIEQLGLTGDGEGARPGPEDHDELLYKKWFRTKSAGGFFTVTPFRTAETGRISLEVGELREGAYAGAAKAFVSLVEFVAWLRRRRGPFERFGGGRTAEGPQSRVIKLSGWRGSAQPEIDGYECRIARYRAEVSGAGAFKPTGEALEAHVIKLSAAELDELLVRCELYAQTLAVTVPEWVLSLYRRRAG